MKKTAVPSLFPWTEPTAASVLARTERVAARHGRQHLLNSLHADDLHMQTDTEYPLGDELVAVAGNAEVIDSVTESHAEGI